MKGELKGCANSGFGFSPGLTESHEGRIERASSSAEGLKARESHEGRIES